MKKVGTELVGILEARQPVSCVNRGVPRHGMGRWPCRKGTGCTGSQGPQRRSSSQLPQGERSGHGEGAMGSELGFKETADFGAGDDGPLGEPFH